MPARSAWLPGVLRALAEDLGSGDVTTRAVLPADARIEAVIEAREPLVVCGQAVVAAVFEALGGAQVEALVPDGERAAARAPVVGLSGSAHDILAGERTALNAFARCCAVATATRRFVDAVAGTGVAIVDTRKTLPGWRALDKYAVRCGGAENHRMGLYDMVMLKDNHWSGASPAALAARVKAFRRRHPRVPIQIEAAGLEQVRQALALKPDLLLLDNMGPALLKKAIALARRTSPRVKLEVSGGVDLKTIRALARLGPDRISVGRLTHSAPALDLSLKIEAP